MWRNALWLVAGSLLAAAAYATPPVPASASTAAKIAASVSAPTLLAGMTQTPPASTPFVEVSYRAMLDRPLVVSGTLHWLGGDRLQRDVTHPFVETATAGNGELSVQRGHGKVHRVPLKRAPQVAALLVGFRALLDGDAASLQHDFALSATGDAAHWVITLAPRAETLRKHLTSIDIDGTGHEPNCLVVSDTNGDATVMLLGKLASAGLPDPAPAKPALLASCRRGAQ